MRKRLLLRQEAQALAASGAYARAVALLKEALLMAVEGDFGDIINETMAVYQRLGSQEGLEAIGRLRELFTKYYRLAKLVRGADWVAGPELAYVFGIPALKAAEEGMKQQVTVRMCKDHMVYLSRCIRDEIEELPLPVR